MTRAILGSNQDAGLRGDRAERSPPGVGRRLHPGVVACNDEDPGRLPGSSSFMCERYWDRTSDLFRVREARYRCANRPDSAWIGNPDLEVKTGFEPVWTALQAAA